MKQLKRIYLMAAVAVLTAGCNEQQEPVDSQGRTPVNLGYTVVESGPTRAATDLNEDYLSSGTLKVSMKKHAAADYPAFVAYTAADGGALTPPPSGRFYYPLDDSPVDLVACYPSETFSAVETDQTTDAAYLASDLMWAKVENQQPTTHTVNLQLRHLMSKIVVNASAGDGVTSINSVTLKNVKPGVASFNPATGAIGDATGTAGEIIMANGGAALIPPQTIDGAFIEIATDLGNTVFSVDTKAFASGCSYAVDVTVNATAIGIVIPIANWGENSTITVHPVNGGDQPNHAPAAVELVDLGLPSGTLWANMNVGATAATDYGTYFAWGETSGLTVSGATSTVVGTPYKTVYQWHTYLWGDGTSNQKFTKYCSLFYSEYLADGYPVDNKTVLDLSDDAAYVNWGGNWRMPTKEEFEELVDNTTSVWTTEGGVAGYKFTSNASGNANYIFLPAAGHRTNSYGQDEGTRGFYNSSTLGGGGRNGSYLDFTSSGTAINNGFRCLGHSIRPVWHGPVSSGGYPIMAPRLGDAYYSDGSWGNNPHADGATVIGVVAWLGNDSDLKCGKSHGLVMALNETSNSTWGPVVDETFLTNTSGIPACQTNDKNGLTNTNNLLADSHTHNAATAARNYSTAAPSTSGNTVWFLPSAAQWLAVMGSSGLGGYTGTFVWGNYASSSTGVVTNINNRLTASGVGGTGLKTGAPYWTSTELYEYDAVRVFFVDLNGVQMNGYNKTAGYLVRPFLAF